MQENEGARWVPLLGILFVVLLLLTFFVFSGDTPDTDASGAKVIDFYTKHDTREVVSSLLGAIAIIPFVFFSAHLRRIFRATETRGFLSTAFWGGALLIAAAAGTGSTIHLTLADVGDKLTPAAAQAINAIDQDYFLPFLVGIAIFLLAAGLIIVRSAVLPKWLGWIAILFFVVTVTPIGWIGFLGSLLFVLIVSVILYMRGGAAPAAGGPPPTAAPIG